MGIGMDIGLGIYYIEARYACAQICTANYRQILVACMDLVQGAIHTQTGLAVQVLYL